MRGTAKTIPWTAAEVLAGSRPHKEAPGIIISNGTVLMYCLDRVRNGFIYGL